MSVVGIPFLPEDVLRKVFILLPTKDLLVCRTISKVWMMVIDDLLENENLWRLRCKEDFKDIWCQANKHRSPGLSIRELYRTLALWSSLRNTVEVVNEYPFTTNISKEIIDFKLMRNGFIGIHSRSAINHYNILTKEDGPIIKGEYRMYAEDNNHVVIIDKYKHLIVSRKAVFKPEMLHYKSIDNVNNFLLIRIAVVLVTTQNEFYFVDLCNDNLEMHFVWIFKEPVMCIGYSQHFYVLTYKQNIYRLVGNTFELEHVISETDNLLSILLKYNLTQQMDWLTYQEWLHIFQYSEPAEGFLHDITCARKYGKTVMIGTKWTDLLIYRTPTNIETVNLYTQKPIKVYNLSDNKITPKYGNSCPIINVDVIEGKDKHEIIAATPTKITTITLHHLSDGISQEMIALWSKAQNKLSLNEAGHCLFQYDPE